MMDSTPTVLLTHLQQLKLWQQQQQESLRNIQKDQFEQIKLEREKVKHLLDKHSSGQTKNHETPSEDTKTTNCKIGTPTFSPAFQIADNDTGSCDNTSHHAMEENLEKKVQGPFRFLKKGEGMSRLYGKTNRARTKSKPPNYNSSKPAPKINSPESRVFVRKLKLLPNSRLKSHESVVFCKNQNIPEGEGEEIEENSFNDSREISEKENEDLAEFEILEKVTRNCSFNSDSSLMHKLVHKVNLSSNLDISEEDCENHLQEEPATRNLISDKVEPFSNTDDLRWRSTDIDDDNKSCSSVDSSESLITSVMKPASTEVIEMVGLKKYCDEMMERIAAGVTESLADDDEAEKWTKWKDLSSLDWSEDTPIDIELDSDVRKSNDQEKNSITIEDSVIKKRLKELENEIMEFKKQNNALMKLRNQHEQLMKQLTKEHEAFKKQQNEAKEKFEEYMKEEKLKLKKQKQSFENYQKSKKEFPDKKEREEIATLKNEVQNLQEELKKQKSQLTAECGRLRAHASSMETERTRKKAEMQRLQNEKNEILAAFKELQSKPPVLKRPVFKTNRRKVPLSKPKHKPEELGDAIKKSVRVSKNDGKDMEIIKNKEELSNFEETRPKQVRFTEMIMETEKGDLSLEDVGQVCEENEYQEIKHCDKVERVYFNGEREFLYNSGTRRLLSEDGSTETVYFYNGDVLLILPDKSEVYHFIESGIKQTKYQDGLILVEFPDGQEERVQKDGTKEVSFKDGSIHLFYPDGTQEIKSVEGSVLKIYPDGSEVLELKNGEKEIHTKDFKRREFPDGTVKIAHSDGKVETRFPNGRIRIKDKDNNIIVDTKYIS